MGTQSHRWCHFASNVLEARAIEGLVAVGTFSVRRPLLTILSCMVFSTVCALGFLNMRVVTSVPRLWQDQDTSIQNNADYVAETFPDRHELFRFVFVGEHDSSNVLTLTAVNSMFDVWEEFSRVTHGDLTFQDVCRQTSAGCAASGILRFFKNSRAYYESQVSSQADLLVALSADRYPDGAPVDRPIVFARWTEDGNGIIQSATLARMDAWLLMGNRPWSKAALQVFVHQPTQLVTRTWPGMRLGVFAAGSVDAELSRSVSGDVSLFTMAFVFMSALTATLLGRPFHLVRGRRLLGILDFVVVCFAVVAGFGISMACGVPFTVLQQALPFILVGIGMDDAFVIVGCFDQTDLSLSVEERIAVTMRRVGMSITLTSLTDIVAFVLATSAAFPAVQYFGIYAALSCLFVWFFHISIFVAMLALDARRQAANHLDCLFCIEAKPTDGLPPTAGPSSNLAACFLGAVFRRLTGNVVLQATVVVIFVACGAVSFLQAMQKLTTDFVVADLCPDVSYVRDFIAFETDHFGSTLIGQAVRVGLYFPDVNHGSAEVQATMLQAAEDVKTLACARDEQSPSWLYDFTAWALSDGLASGVVSASDFADASDCTEVNGFGCRFVVGDALAPAVAHFVSLEVGESRADAVVFDSDTNPTRIISSVIYFRLVDLHDSKEMVNALEEIEEWVDAYQDRVPGMMASSYSFGFWDQFRIIVQELLRSIGLCMVSVVALSFIVLKSPRSVFLVFITLMLVFVDLVGCISLWGLDLNSISMVNLIMAVGLVVDYSMHVAHCFGSQDTSRTRKERAVRAMEEIGGAVLLGIGSTFVAIMPLSLAGSEVFRVFFKMFLSITVVGGFHGVILLPVMLSLVGPTAENTTEIRASETGQQYEEPD